MATLHKHNKYGPSDASYVSNALESIPTQPLKRRRSESVSADSPGKEITSDGTAKPRKSKKIRRIISDGSSDAGEDSTAPASNTEKSQITVSSGINTLQSPPPEIEDSQEVALKPRSTISVIVPPPPTDSQRELFVPISSGFECKPSSQISTTTEVRSSGEAINSDYPTPASENVQSPAFSDQHSPLFYSDIALTPPQESPPSCQTQGQNLTSQFAASRRASEVLATQITSSGRGDSVQVSASGEVPQSQEDSLPRSLRSAQPIIGLTSPVHETQASRFLLLSHIGGDFWEHFTRTVQRAGQLSCETLPFPVYNRLFDSLSNILRG